MNRLQARTPRLDDLAYIHRRDTQDVLGALDKRWQVGPVVTGPIVAPRSSIHIDLHGVWPPRCIVPATDCQLSWSRGTELARHTGPGTAVLLVAPSLAAATPRRQAYEARGCVVYVCPPQAASDGCNGWLVHMLLRLSAWTTPPDWAAAASAVTRLAGQWTADVPLVANPAKQLAQELLGKALVVLAPDAYRSAAASWRQAFRLYAKQPAWLEPADGTGLETIAGWSGPMAFKPFGLCSLGEDPALIAARQRQLSGQLPYVQAVPVPAELTDWLERNMYMASLGDYVATYTALLTNTDPANTASYRKYQSITIGE